MSNDHDSTLSLLKALVQSLVGELRFKKTHSKALPSIKKKKKKKERKGHIEKKKRKERNQDSKTTVTEMKEVFERLTSRIDTAKENL